jgi:sec-independent protein translocase protein TatB
MFDISSSEILLIAVVALIFIGPKELPQVLRSFGQAVSKLRRTAEGFRRQFEESMREAGYEDLHKSLKDNLNDIRQLNPAHQLRSSLDRAINQDYPPKLVSPAAAPELVPAAETPVLDSKSESLAGGEELAAVKVEAVSEPREASAA